MFGIGWDLLQPKGNIIAPIVFIPAKKKHLKFVIVSIGSIPPSTHFPGP